jgi:hypothetical protein
MHYYWATSLSQSERFPRVDQEEKLCLELQIDDRRTFRGLSQLKKQILMTKAWPGSVISALFRWRLLSDHSYSRWSYTWRASQMRAQEKFDSNFAGGP